MAGNFALDTTAHPTTNFIVFAAVNGSEIKLNGTPVAIANPSDRATAKALVKQGGVKFVTET